MLDYTLPVWNVFGRINVSYIQHLTNNSEYVFISDHIFTNHKLSTETTSN